MLMRQGWDMAFRNQGRGCISPSGPHRVGVPGAERWEEAHEGMSEEKKKFARWTKTNAGYLPQ